jgi:hypothetical protein
MMLMMLLEGSRLGFKMQLRLYQDGGGNKMAIVKINLNKQQMNLLCKLVVAGLYGSNVNDVIVRIIDQFLGGINDQSKSQN